MECDERSQVKLLKQIAADGMAIQEDVGGVEDDVVARHVPDAIVEAATAP